MIKIKKRKILLLPGDGIGPEVIQEVKKIILWLNSNKSLDFEIDQDLAGGCSYDKHGTPITDEVFYKALESEVVMLGAVGGPKWDDLDFSKKPERALLKLRKELKLFANLTDIEKKIVDLLFIEKTAHIDTLKLKCKLSSNEINEANSRDLANKQYCLSIRGLRPKLLRSSQCCLSLFHSHVVVITIFTRPKNESISPPRNFGEASATYAPILSAAAADGSSCFTK